MTPPITLTIAGTDSSAGAGIQADLKTFAAHGVYGFSAITAVVAQTPGCVSAMTPVPAELLAQQLDCLAERYPIAAAKTGMLTGAEHVEVVVDFFRGHPDIELVVDPVIAASAGAELLDAEGVKLLLSELLPLASLATPNLDEAEAILGESIKEADSFEKAAHTFSEKRKCNVLIKGGHFYDDETVSDVAWIDGQSLLFSRKRLSIPDLHGTGCTLSAAITAQLAHGEPMESAIRLARDYLYDAMRAHFSWNEGDHDKALNHFPYGVLALDPEEEVYNEEEDE